MTAIGSKKPAEVHRRGGCRLGMSPGEGAGADGWAAAPVSLCEGAEGRESSGTVAMEENGHTEQETTATVFPATHSDVPSSSSSSPESGPFLPLRPLRRRRHDPEEQESNDKHDSPSGGKALQSGRWSTRRGKVRMPGEDGNSRGRLRQEGQVRRRRTPAHQARAARHLVRHPASWRACQPLRMPPDSPPPWRVSRVRPAADYDIRPRRMGEVGGPRRK